jgi:tetratricopeptide (TPR) repeat protein
MSEFVGDSNQPPPARIGMTDVQAVEENTQEFRVLDYRRGGGSCRAELESLVSRGEDLLGADAAEPVHVRLLIALADLHNLAGWTSFDVGLVDEAHFHFDRALELARPSHNDDLVANILYRSGRVYLHHNAPGQALAMFQLGESAAVQAGSELAIAILHSNEAWAYANMGSQGEALEQLNLARRAFAKADLSAPPVWARFFTEVDMAAMIGTVHTELAHSVDSKHSRMAIPALQTAVDGYEEDMSRSWAFNLAALATNHLIQGDVDEAAEVGVQALRRAEGVESARCKDRMLPLKAAAERRPDSADARDLAEQIAAFIALRGPQNW